MLLNGLNSRQHLHHHRSCPSPERIHQPSRSRLADESSRPVHRNRAFFFASPHLAESTSLSLVSSTRSCFVFFTLSLLHRPPPSLLLFDFALLHLSFRSRSLTSTRTSSPTTSETKSSLSTPTPKPPPSSRPPRETSRLSSVRNSRLLSLATPRPTDRRTGGTR
jgi:hypothetical protein